MGMPINKMNTNTLINRHSDSHQNPYLNSPKHWWSCAHFPAGPPLVQVVTIPHKDLTGAINADSSTVKSLSMKNRRVVSILHLIFISEVTLSSKITANRQNLDPANRQIC
jgi:hypothetical protein